MVSPYYSWISPLLQCIRTMIIQSRPNVFVFYQVKNLIIKNHCKTCNYGSCNFSPFLLTPNPLHSFLEFLLDFLLYLSLSILYFLTLFFLLCHILFLSSLFLLHMLRYLPFFSLFITVTVTLLLFPFTFLYFNYFYFLCLLTLSLSPSFLSSPSPFIALPFLSLFSFFPFLHFFHSLSLHLAVFFLVSPPSFSFPLVLYPCLSFFLSFT